MEKRPRTDELTADVRIPGKRSTHRESAHHLQGQERSEAQRLLSSAFVPSTVESDSLLSVQARVDNSTPKLAIPSPQASHHLHSRHSRDIATYPGRSLHDLQCQESPYGQYDESLSSHRMLNPVEALSYLENIKLRFHDRLEVYKCFLDIMKDFKSQMIDTIGVIQRIKDIFHGHTDLILGFNKFLPPGFFIDVDEPHAQYREAEVPPNEHGLSGSGAMGRQTTSGKYDIAQFSDKYDSAYVFIKKIKARFSHEPSKYFTFLDLLHNYQTGVTSLPILQEKIEGLFSQDIDLVTEFRGFIPNIASSASKNSAEKKPMPLACDSSQLTNIGYDIICSSRTIVTAAPIPTNPSTTHHKSYVPLPVVTMSPNKKRDIPEQDKNFDMSTDKGEREVVGIPPEIQFFGRFKDKLAPNELFESVVKIVQSHLGEKSKQPLIASLEQILQPHREILQSFVQEFAKDASVTLDSPHELLNQSYQTIPDDELVLIASGRTSLCDSVLNDIFVSQPKGSEEGFSHSRKSHLDEAIFKCEDEQHDLDVIINTNISTINLLKKIIKDFSEVAGNSQLKAYDVTDVLYPTHLRNIRKIYGSRGVDVIEGLKSNPVLVAPIILKRLKQKDEELKIFTKERSKVFRESVESNYQKASENQWNSNKQSDRRVINPKIMIQEAYQLKEKQTSKEHYCFYFFDKEALIAVMSLLDKFAKRSGYDVAKWKRLFNLLVRPFFDLDGDDRVETDSNKQLVGTLLTEKRPVLGGGGKAKRFSQGLTFSPFHVAPEKRYHPKHTMLANNSFYVFFRHIQILYDKVAQAKRLFFLQNRGSYPILLSLLVKCFEDTIDSISFEDEIKTVFGREGYFLGSLDRLVSLIKKEILVILECETCARLVSLYIFEQQRTHKCEGFLYLSNVMGLLSQENCFRLEYRRNQRALIIQYLDNESHESSLVQVERKWSLYVDEFFKGEAKVYKPKSAKVFMQRNVNKVKSEGERENLYIQNQLECKISIITFKMLFVEGTEDVLFRLRRQGKKRCKASMVMTASPVDSSDCAATLEPGRQCHQSRRNLTKIERMSETHTGTVVVPTSSMEREVHSPAVDAAVAMQD